jgi:hypothetical protein
MPPLTFTRLVKPTKHKLKTMKETNTTNVIVNQTIFIETNKTQIKATQNKA